MLVTMLVVMLAVGEVVCALLQMACNVIMGRDFCNWSVEHVNHFTGSLMKKTWTKRGTTLHHLFWWCRLGRKGPVEREPQSEQSVP